MFKLTDNPFIIYNFWSVNVSVLSDIKRLGKKKKRIEQTHSLSPFKVIINQ